MNQPNRRKACPGSTLFAAVPFFLAALLPGSMHAAEAVQPVSTGTVSVAITCSNVAITTNASGTARFGGAEIIGEPGQPGMPSIVIRILLPPDADLGSARVELRDAEKEDMPGKWNVEPYSPPATHDGEPIWPEGTRIENGKDITAYSADAYHPTSFIGLVKGAPLREWRVLTVRLYPYLYNPTSQRLTRLNSGTLAVSFRKTPQAIQMTSRSSRIAQAVREKVKQTVLNFDSVATDYR